ncbi:hypothetical protein ABID26_000227 [Mesorhizobium shonense]|uniref:Uncharacterized protein n=1 Tax=Mesorhizobium shonense TaxID=1209948 RepID=A0ABV2HJX2_9HYPH|nr:hypothetical protein [Mesorhizobium sp. M1B.F.Ca.ET.045.04.1.1]AZO31120.1 hypothetical protein EJ071_29505 [Mesorhizobium sp. M1B.F.Ca.ET.045.04.1.1]
MSFAAAPQARFITLAAPTAAMIRAKAERDGVDLKRVAIFQIRSMRFSFLILRMSLSRNRFPLSGDML